jgi:hypothetical protein
MSEKFTDDGPSFVSNKAGLVKSMQSQDMQIGFFLKKENMHLGLHKVIKGSRKGKKHDLDPVLCWFQQMGLVC